MFYEARGRKKYYYGMIAQMLNRSTAPSITYTCCCAIVLMLHNVYVHEALPKMTKPNKQAIKNKKGVAINN